ncbi:hypothetical protein Tco_0776916 [Tanacetum coccineum]
MTKLTQKKVAFEWGDKQEAAFQTLKNKIGCGVDAKREVTTGSKLITTGSILVTTGSILVTPGSTKMVTTDRWIDARVVVEAADRKESETGMRGPIKEGAIEVAYEALGDLVQMFHDHIEAIPVHRVQLERDNRRLRGTVSVESQRVDRLQRGMACMQRELRQIRRKIPNTQSGASRTREAINKQSDRRIAEALRVRDAIRNLGPLMGDEVEQEEVGGNGNGGNGDRGNGNGGNRDGGNGN